VTPDWHPTIDQIADDDAGLTSADDSRTIAAHLAECSACRQTAERLAEVSAVLSEAGATVEPMPAEVADALDLALAAASAERAAGVPSLDERRAARGDQAAPGHDTVGTGSGRRGRWVFGAAAAVAVFAIGAAVANNGLPGSTSSDDSAASTTRGDSDAAGDAAGGQAEAGPQDQPTANAGSLIAGAPELNADNVDAYAQRLAAGKTTPTAPERATCGDLTPQTGSDAVLTSTLSSIVSYDGNRAVLRVDRHSRRLTVLSCPGPTRVLYSSSY
jgi:hypothetical protein